MDDIFVFSTGKVTNCLPSQSRQDYNCGFQIILIKPNKLDELFKISFQFPFGML